MCHLLLLLPLITLPVFWILPFGPALSVYGTILAVSAAIYWYAIRAMRRPVQTGAEGMVGEIGEVIESRGANLVVHARSEIWHAESAVQMLEGDRVKVVAVEDLTLRVQKLEVKSADAFSDAAPMPPCDSGRIKGGAMTVAKPLCGATHASTPGRLLTFARHAAGPNSTPTPPVM